MMTKFSNTPPAPEILKRELMIVEKSHLCLDGSTCDLDITSEFCSELDDVLAALERKDIEGATIQISNILHNCENWCGRGDM